MDHVVLRRAILVFAFGVLAAVDASAQNPHVRLQIDAMSEPNPASKGAFPSLADAPKLPIQLRVAFLLPADGPRGIVLADFTITNTGRRPILLPTSSNGRGTSSRMLRLTLTSEDAITDSLMVPWCADLYQNVGDPKSSVTLAPGASIIVHTRCRFPAPSHQASFSAHAELIALKDGTSFLIGAASSIASLYKALR